MGSSTFEDEPLPDRPPANRHERQAIEEWQSVLSEQLSRAEAAHEMGHDVEANKSAAIATLKELLAHPSRYSYSSLRALAEDRARFGSFVFHLGIVAAAYLKAVNLFHGRTTAWRRQQAQAWGFKSTAELDAFEGRTIAPHKKDSKPR